MANGVVTTRTESRHLWIVFGLGALTLLAFFGVWRNDFVNYDDNNYVFLNSHVRRGLDLETVTWAFTQTHAFNWHPLTSLSHALDCQLFGLSPAGHHITNLILHTANVILLFLALGRLTGAVWRSALVAALFAVHPLHVESVAWVAERKDVLSGFFFMLTLLAYAKYAISAELPSSHLMAKRTSSSPGNESNVRPSSSNQYILAFLFFAFGLMSKPMLVTMPFVLLLLDFWPLQRLQPAINGKARSIGMLLREKIPFFVLSAASCAVTLGVQAEGVQSTESFSLGARLGNASLAYLAYLKQIFWPTKLAVFYPHPRHLQAWAVVAAVAFIVVGSLLILGLARKWRFVATGWLWYLGMLVPVIGIVQVGAQARADRYMYLPAIGLFIIVAWGLAGLVAVRPRMRFPLLGASAAAIVALAVTAHQQVAVWRNTHTLFAHAAKVTRDNYLALSLLAKEDLEAGRIAEATTNLQAILEIAPKYPNAEYLLGTALQMQGKMQEAVPHLEAAVGPEVGIPAKARLVLSFLDAGRLDEAQRILEPLVRANPGDPNGWLMAAALLKEQGRTSEAGQLFSNVITHNPKFLLDTPTLNFELAELYTLQGSNREASVYYSKALELSPQFTNALNNFAWMLATSPDDQVRNGKRAVELAQRGCELTSWRQPVFIGTLAAAYAEAGQFDDAVKMGERARALAQKQGNEPVAKRNGELLEVYRQHKAYREK